MSEFKTFQGFIVKDETARNEVENLRGDFEKHTHSKSEIEDFAHTHNRSEIEDFAHSHKKSDIEDFTHSHKKSEITDFAHTHSKSEITDFAHTHSKSEITDFTHTHSKSEITDFAHGHNVSEVEGAVSIELLWENPAPANDFTETTIDINSEEYDMLEIHFALTSTSPVYNLLPPIRILNIQNRVHHYSWIYVWNFLRIIKTYRDNGTITFDNAVIYRTYGSATTEVVNNYLVPYRIYGIKGVK